MTPPAPLSDPAYQHVFQASNYIAELSLSPPSVSSIDSVQEFLRVYRSAVLHFLMKLPQPEPGVPHGSHRAREHTHTHTHHTRGVPICWYGGGHVSTDGC